MRPAVARPRMSRCEDLIRPPPGRLQALQLPPAPSCQKERGASANAKAPPLWLKGPAGRLRCA